MPYPYKKMTQEDFDKIIEITDNERVWVGDEIAKEYYKDEMPEYGVFPPELYVEVLNKEEVFRNHEICLRAEYSSCLPWGRNRTCRWSNL